MFSHLITAFRRDKKGAVSIIGALTLPVLIGMIALAAEYGHALVVKRENQRTADLAAYAAGLTYSSSSSTSAMTATAQNVAVLNGVASTAVTANLVTSPRTSSSQAVYVNIETNQVLLLAPVLKSGSSVPVNGKSYAQLNATSSACILALASSGTGVTLSGGTSITAPSCSVASNNTVSVPCGDTISAKTVTYGGTTPSQPCTGITGTLTHATTTDPLASNSTVSALRSHATSLSSLTGPSAPSVTTGNPISFAYSTSSTQAQASAIGCSATFSGSTWTLTCPSGGTYHFSNVTVGGGITVNFNTSGSASTTYDFSGSINNTGTAMTFGPGTYNIVQGITTGGGTTTTFGAGTYNIGASTSSCNGAGLFSICNAGTTLTFGGPSTFNLSAGIYNSGGSTLVLGSGTTNSFKIGASSTGNALQIGGGSKTTFADATGSGNLFQMAGNLNASAGGGSCLTLSAAAQHDIDGYLSVAGGTLLGSGVWSVYSYIAFGANGGGDVSCNGTSIGVSGTNVTLVTAGTSTSSGSCASFIFCIAAGFSSVSLSAPTSGTYAYMGVIGPASITSGASLTEGASNTLLSGAFYFPAGPLTLSGGASIGNQTGQCLQLIASQISLTGGTRATAASCVSSSSSASTVQLVQ